jgi:hypothetical protein
MCCSPRPACLRLPTALLAAALGCVSLSQQGVSARDKACFHRQLPACAILKLTCAGPEGFVPKNTRLSFDTKRDSCYIPSAHGLWQPKPKRAGLLKGHTPAPVPIVEDKAPVPYDLERRLKELNRAIADIAFSSEGAAQLCRGGSVFSPSVVGWILDETSHQWAAAGRATGQSQIRQEVVPWKVPAYSL